MEIIVEENKSERIDKYLAMVTDYSRSKIQKLIEEGKILVNGDVINSHNKVSLNDKIEIIGNLDVNHELKPSDIPIDIVYENDDLLVINKKSGMVVHPAPGNYEDTLVNALVGRYNLSTSDIRRGIVHRLDKDIILL